MSYPTDSKKMMKSNSKKHDSTVTLKTGTSSGGAIVFPSWTSHPPSLIPAPLTKTAYELALAAMTFAKKYRVEKLKEKLKEYGFEIAIANGMAVNLANSENIFPQGRRALSESSELHKEREALADLRLMAQEKEEAVKTMIVENKKKSAKKIITKQKARDAARARYLKNNGNAEKGNEDTNSKEPNAGGSSSSKDVAK